MSKENIIDSSLTDKLTFSNAQMIKMTFKTTSDFFYLKLWSLKRGVSIILIF